MKVLHISRRDIITVILVGILIPVLLAVGASWQASQDQQVVNNKLNHISCAVAQMLQSYFSSKNESVTIITNPDDSCGLQFQVGFNVTLTHSASFSVSISRANTATTLQTSTTNTNTTTAP